MGYKLFGKNIEPSCEYCEFGNKTKDEQMVLCIKNGVVSPTYSCKKYIYSPLKREPKPPLVVTRYKKEDFEL
jgi:hypothetical protein